MKRAVYISMQPLFPDFDGGRKISLGRLIQLKNEYDSVHSILYNYAKTDADSYSRFLAGEYVDYKEIAPCRPEGWGARLFRYFLSLAKRRPEPIGILEHDSEFCFFIKKFLEGFESSDIIDVYLDSVFLFPIVKHSMPDNVRFNILFHNVESMFYRELFRCSKGWLRKCFYFIESGLLKCLEDEIFMFSKLNNKFSCSFLTVNDKDYYQNKYSLINNRNMILNHNTIRCGCVVVHSPDLSSKFLLFPGSLNFPPNRQGVELFLEHFDAELGRLGVKLIVTGKISRSTHLEFSCYNNVDFVGMVDDEILLGFYSSTLAVVSPIFSGGGLKIKNIETISLGVPLVATRFSCIGVTTSIMEKSKVLVSEDSIDSFCDELSAFLNDEYKLS